MAFNLFDGASLDMIDRVEIILMSTFSNSFLSI